MRLAPEPPKPPARAPAPEAAREMARRLAEEFRAEGTEAIYLFGSHAWGVPGPDSDLDLYVIVSRSHERPVRRQTRARGLARGLAVPVDILVRTRAEFEQHLSAPASLARQVRDEGIPLHGN